MEWDQRILFQDIILQLVHFFFQDILFFLLVSKKQKKIDIQLLYDVDDYFRKNKLVFSPTNDPTHKITTEKNDLVDNIDDPSQSNLEKQLKAIPQNFGYNSKLDKKIFVEQTFRYKQENLLLCIRGAERMIEDLENQIVQVEIKYEKKINERKTIKGKETQRKKQKKEKEILEGVIEMYLQDITEFNSELIELTSNYDDDMNEF